MSRDINFRFFNYTSVTCELHLFVAHINDFLLNRCVLSLLLEFYFCNEEDVWTKKNYVVLKRNKNIWTPMGEICCSSYESNLPKKISSSLKYIVL